MSAVTAIAQSTLAPVPLRDGGKGPGHAPLVDFSAFDPPDSHPVHDHVFPLGLGLADSSQNASLTDVTAQISRLAAVGTIRDLLTKHGAILFHGLPLSTPEDFSSFVQSFNFIQPHQEIGLSGKRSNVTTYIKTASELPSTTRMHYHNEYARSAHFPEIIFFFAEKVPRKGGQTPLLSSVELYDRVKEDLPEFVEKLAVLGVIGRQYYPSIDDPDWKEIGWNWKDSFGFDIQAGDSLEVQHQKVEKVLAKDLEATAEWQPDGSLHVLQHVPAIRRVKSTGQATFFNGLAGVYGNARDNGALEPPYRNQNGIGYKLPTTYGDGSDIPHAYLERLIEIQDEIGYLVNWQVGDVVVANNFTVQHSRTTWEGERSILVSLWDDINDLKPY